MSDSTKKEAMKNVIVANWKKTGKTTKEELEKLLRAQIENAIEVGWEAYEIVAVTNFPFSFMNVDATQFEMPDFCLTGSKMFAVQKLFVENYFPGSIFWMHDLDCWQNVWFDVPDFKDVGVTHYSRPKINGGSVFWRASAQDLIDEIVNALVLDRSAKEEPTLQKVLKDKTARVTVLNSTFNVGCSGFVPRYNSASKPVRVCHFHPTNRLAWETHTLDRNRTGNVSVGVRLNRLIRKYWSHLAIELRPDGKEKRKIAQNGGTLTPKLPSQQFLLPSELKKTWEDVRNNIKDRSILASVVKACGIGLNIKTLRLAPELMEHWGNMKLKQYPDELAELLGFIYENRAGINSYLEIGCERGGTFCVIDSYLRAVNPNYATGVALDVTNRWGWMWDRYKQIYPCAKFEQIASANYPEAQFDLVFIDGDHSYEGVKKDWERFRGSAKIIAFHDIFFEPGVRKLWNEIRCEGDVEFKSPHSIPLGIGLKFNPVNPLIGK
jgi:hypothetical protein